MENNKEKSVSEMFDLKYKKIDAYRSETDLAIRISWAVNNAVAILVNGREMAHNKLNAEELNELVNFFLNYFDKKKSELLNVYEQEYQKNPTPLVSDYEKMPDAQKKFLKDKQLANNRRSYHERKEAAKQSAELSVSDEE